MRVRHRGSVPRVLGVGERPAGRRARQAFDLNLDAQVHRNFVATAEGGASEPRRDQAVHRLLDEAGLRDCAAAHQSERGDEKQDATELGGHSWEMEVACLAMAEAGGP